MDGLMPTNESVIYKMWRLRKTMYQMMHDRGYLISQRELDETLERFCEEHGDKPLTEKRPRRSDLTLVVAHKADPSDIIIVFFSDDTKVGIRTVRDCLIRMSSADVLHGIIVCTGLTPTAKMALGELPRYRMEYFMEEELMYNVTEHELVSQHIIMTEDEKTELLSRYKIQMHQLMRIKTTDMVSRYYGFQRGQIVKIVRSSETAGRYISYRVVI